MSTRRQSSGTDKGHQAVAARHTPLLTAAAAVYLAFKQVSMSSSSAAITRPSCQVCTPKRSNSQLMAPVNVRQATMVPISDRKGRAGSCELHPAERGERVAVGSASGECKQWRRHLWAISGGDPRSGGPVKHRRARVD